RSVPGRIGAQMSISGTGKDNTRDDSGSRRLSVGAARRSPTTFGRRGGDEPKLFSGCDLQRGNSRLASCSAHIGYRNVYVLLIGCESPLDSSQRAAVADLNFPEPLAAVVGIKPIDHAGLLSRENDLLAVGQRSQNRRGAKVVVGPRLFGAVAHARLAAANKEVVPGRDLVKPLDLTGGHIVRDDGVSMMRLNIGVGIAGADVDYFAF